MKPAIIKIININCLLLCLSLNGFTQEIEKVDPADFLSSKLKPVRNDPYQIQPSSNEVVFLMNILFSGYKFIFSSQDVNSCTFQPSCSVYAIESIRQKGVIAGGMAALDRLTRCNGLSPEHYSVDRKMGKLLDPVIR